MQLGEVIRHYRKRKNMTQAEMADRLGVTAPAVNKWENGNSMPDILLLSPIARLLDITLDTLLSFRETLTAEEINTLICELDSRLRNEPYQEAFAWAEKQIALYPNCEPLALRLAQVLDAWRLSMDVPDAVNYDDAICGCYERALESGDEDVRHTAADALFGFYCRKEQYETAEAYLVYLPEQNPEKKRKQAELYSKTGRMQEAYKAYEELLFSSYQMIYMVLYGMTMLAMQQKNLKKAHYLVEKQTRLVHLFEMGPYYEASAGLTLAIEEKDVDGTLEAMAGILGSVQNICAFCQSPLYEHMTFKSPRREFVAQLKKNLLERFRDEETFDFLKTDKRWEELVK